MVTSPDYQVNNHMQDASNLPVASQAWSPCSPSRPPKRAAADILPPRFECILIQMMKVNLLCVPQGVIGEKWRERGGIRPGVVQLVQVKVSQTTSGHVSLLTPLQGLFFDGEGTSDERDPGL